MLAKKGFGVDVETDERQFAMTLRQGRHRVAWIISSSVANFAASTDPSAGTEALQQMVLACRDFHCAGGGLLLFGENEPFFLHANLVLAALGVDWRLSGNNQGGNFVLHSQNDNPPLRVQQNQSNGRLVCEDHCVMTGILTLFEGETVCLPETNNVERHFDVLATGGFARASGKSAYPLVLASKNEGLDSSGGGAGRVVVDMGYTKLWLEWRTGGTDRYIGNATAWLTSVDRLLAEASKEERFSLPPSIHVGRPSPHHTLSGELARDCLVSSLSAAMPKSVELVVVVDMSGSMQPFVNEARTFCRKLLDYLEVGRKRNLKVCLVGFSNHVIPLMPRGVDFTDDRRVLFDSINRIVAGGGTYFAAPLEYISRLWSRPNDGRTTRLVLFQTDGANFDRPQAKARAAHLVNSQNATIVGVCVGAAAVSAGIQEIVGKSGRFQFQRVDEAELIVSTANYQELVGHVARIADTAMGASTRS
jgi:hypothetical protein